MTFDPLDDQDHQFLNGGGKEKLPPKKIKIETNDPLKSRTEDSRHTHYALHHAVTAVVATHRWTQHTILRFSILPFVSLFTLCLARSISPPVNSRLHYSARFLGRVQPFSTPTLALR